MAGRPFTEAHEVTVTTVPDRASKAAYKRPVMIPVAVGGEYRVSFYCRSEQGAEFNAIFQQNGAPYKHLAHMTVKADAEWKRVEMVAEGVKDAHEPGGSVLTCHLGGKLQTVQFADVRVEKVR